MGIQRSKINMICYQNFHHEKFWSQFFFSSSHFAGLLLLFLVIQIQSLCLLFIYFIHKFKAFVCLCLWQAAYMLNTTIHDRYRSPSCILCTFITFTLICLSILPLFCTFCTFLSCWTFCPSGLSHLWHHTDHHDSMESRSKNLGLAILSIWSPFVHCSPHAHKLDTQKATYILFKACIHTYNTVICNKIITFFIFL